MIQASYQRAIQRRCQAYDITDLSRSALVFSPHFDDETLGCGGIILQKQQAGATLGLVFMTDGSQSHKHLISEQALSNTRTAEGAAAAQLLGLKEQQVFFLGYRENRLKQQYTKAVARVMEIILAQKPEEIFLPYYRDPPEDHTITTAIVRSALKQCAYSATLYEYPIWFWHHWPKVSLLPMHHWEIKGLLKNTLATGLGARLLFDFNCRININEQLEKKHQVLDQHKSQMTRLGGNANWITLEDVSNGSFLDCFFQPHEIFRRYKV